MLSGKTFPIYTVLERIFRTSGYAKHLNLDDAVELAGEAIDLIGAPTALHEKITDGNDALGHPKPIVITDYKGALPSDLHRIIQTRDYDTKVPLRLATNTFHGAIVCEGSMDYRCSSDFSYKIKNHAIHTNFQEGNVEMAYLAFHVDEHGLPLIPAEERYVKGIEAYIVEALYRPLWEVGKIPDKVYARVERERDWYIGSAFNAAVMPNVDEAISMKNAMIRMIPDVVAPEDFFISTGEYPTKYNHNNAGSWSR
jgi:hypothetical protein